MRVLATLGGQVIDRGPPVIESFCPPRWFSRSFALSCQIITNRLFYRRALVVERFPPHLDQSFAACLVGRVGGIQRGQFLLMESDQIIDIAVGNSTNLFVPAKVLALSDGDFEQVWIRNNSSTNVANVWLGAVD